ncbi:MAG: hydroxymethylbilane synthase [Raineya sp.]|nr:hydroxymethylbilane synthase [Raineya sp.]MDW8297043.1 hydroxymethylbilane synthase [Raineya sp.]
MKLKIITRSSRLALWQTELVAKKLQNAGLETEIVTIETKGDKILDRSLSKIGSKGVFTEELEAKLLSGEVQLAVHSAKDLPSHLPEGLKIIAFTEREQVHDVLVSFKKEISLQDKIVVGTSSTRRIAILKHFYPHIQTTEIRGNLQTRLQKLQNGLCDALILAYAGIKRMNYEHLICEHLSLDIFTPTAGQGSIAVEISENLDENLQEQLKTILNHEATAVCVRAERAFLHTLQGGCSVPVFVLATWQGSEIFIQGGLLAWNGERIIRKKALCLPENAQEIAINLAQEVLASGGETILKQKTLS